MLYNYYKKLFDNKSIKYDWIIFVCEGLLLLVVDSVPAKPYLIGLIRIAYSVNWKKYETRNYWCGPIKYRECNCTYSKYNWIVFYLALKSVFIVFIAFSSFFKVVCIWESFVL